MWSRILHDSPVHSTFLCYLFSWGWVWMQQNFSFHLRVHFKVKFIEASHPLPPPRAFFPDSKTCQAFSEFISNYSGPSGQWIFVGLGEVGEASPPNMVMPITIEPSIPYMCHDERFLNLWIKELPFSLDIITDLPCYVLNNSFQTM